MNVLMIYPNSTGNPKIPLGIILILTLLKEKGHRVRLFDITFYGLELEKHDILMRGRMLNFRPMDLEPYGVTYRKSSLKDVDIDLAEEIRAFRPDIIGVSLTEDTSVMGFHLGAVAKRSAPATPLVYGGVFCMTMPERVAAQPSADMICIGEGEALIVALAERLSQGRDPSDIPGLWLKREDGSIARNPVGPPASLDALPIPDLSLVDGRHFFSPMAGHVYKMAFVESQRGCPRRCTYCCNQLFLNAYSRHLKKYIRKKSVPRLMAELASLKRDFGINFFQFVDDDFLLRSEKDIALFCDSYQKAVGVPFWIQAEANNTTDEKVRLIKAAGCIAVSMGIETGSDKIREEVYRRHTKKEATIRAFELLHAHGIRTSGNVIIGVPQESRREVFETIALVRKCRPKSLNVNIFAPYLGTELRDYCVKNGYLRDDFVRESRISWKAVLDMPQITQEEVEGLARTFVLYSTLPEEYFSEIEKCERNSQESDRIFSELEKVFWEIADREGIDYHIPGFDYDGFLAARKAELAARHPPCRS